MFLLLLRLRQLPLSFFVDAYKQTLNPTVVYTDNPAEEKRVKDTFARKKSEDEYVIIEYEGSNLISKVEAEIMGVML